MSLKTATHTPNTASFTNFVPATHEQTAEINALPNADTLAVAEFALTELQAQMKSANRSAQTVAMRIAKEVERICQKSDRIQISGDVRAWQITLAQHRLNKILEFYHFGSRQVRSCYRSDR